MSIKVLKRRRGSVEVPAFVRLTRKTLRYRAPDVDAFIAGRFCASTDAA